MKSRLIIGTGIGVVILAFAAFFFWPASTMHDIRPIPPVTSVPAHATTSPFPTLSKQEPTSNTNSKIVRMKKHVIHGAAWTPEEKAMMHERAEQIAKDPNSEWKTPIEFYGIVVDENNQPLSGATAKWGTTTLEGNGHGEAISGSDGRFSIQTVGKFMSVDVQKEGYRTAEYNQGYEFSAFFQDNYYDGDKEHPTIFHLHKIPPFEPIYIWNKQVRNANHLIGSQSTFNPQTGQLSVGSGREGISMQLVPGSENTPDQLQFDIILMTSGGGVLKADDPRADQAPEGGYTNPSDQKLTLDASRQRIVETTVFFKDGAGNYGKFYLDMELLGHELSIIYHLRYNPHGGTSLSAPQGSEFQINK